MIIDRIWNKKEQKLIISYIDKLGNRQFYQKYFHHFKTYEYDEDGEFENWNGRRIKRVFKDTLTYTPNEFDILEFLYEMDPEMNKLFHAQYFPKLYTWDIETEVSDEFPDPEKAEQKITAISLVGPDMSCIVYGLHNLSIEKQERFKKRYLDWIENNEFAKNYKETKLKGKTPKVLYQYFATEEKLIKHFFTKILPNVPAIAGWNSYNFDWRYMINRVIRLFGKGEMYNLIRRASPTGELTTITYTDQSGLHYKLPSPAHVANLDYMELVKQYDYVLRPYESYSLDWVGSNPNCVKAHKIKYEGTLQQLYERDPEWYYFYNAIDSLIVNLIHKRLKSLESPCAVDSVTLVPLNAAMGQIALTTANVFKEFYDDGKHVVWDYDAIERRKIPYEGAFCACVPGRYSFTVCDDFASLYPSQVQTCNLSFENFLQKYSEPDSLGRRIPIAWTEEELEEKRKDPNYFVTVMGNVYKNDKDYCFKKMQRRTKKNRDFYKYTGQKLESELIYAITQLINGKDVNIEFSDDIKDVIKNHFDNVDIYKLNKEELESLKVEVSELREEYSLLELAMKTLGNAAYGASASPFFYFFNASLAADITGECRNLTKTMWNKLEHFFHETIWERKDLWKEFGFELDESKHDWYREQPISIYSDTDSVYTTYGTFFDCWTKESLDKIPTKMDKIKWILNFNKKFIDKQNNQWCDEIYNPRHGKNIHEFELETISEAQLGQKKKKYLKAYSFVKGKFYDTPKISGTGIELIKSTTPKLCRVILKDLMESLLLNYDEHYKSEFILEFNEKLRNYRKQFYNAPIEDISQSVGVGNYKKFVINDEDELKFANGCPVSVHSIARYNYLAHKNGEDNKKTYSGKIKYYNITIGDSPKNAVHAYFGFPSGELPEWAPKMDKLVQWGKTVIDPINRFLEVMKLPLANATNTIQYSLFGDTY